MHSFDDLTVGPDFGLGAAGPGPAHLAPVLTPIGLDGPDKVLNIHEMVANGLRGLVFTFPDFVHGLDGLAGGPDIGLAGPAHLMPGLGLIERQGPVLVLKW